jgi:putative polyketide hydroxylase
MMDSQVPNRDVPAKIPVLIVGGGPVGLSMSLLLSHYGIRSLLVEQHPGTSTYPKARLLKARMMEIFRQLGIEQAIRNVAIPHNRNLIFAGSLAGEEIHRRPIETVLPEFVRDWSPTSGCTSTQDVVEPVLLEHARRNEQAQVRFNTQLASFEQRDDHVLAVLVHRPSGRVQQVRAQYLIGADGAHSPVRQALGIRMLGQPVLSYAINILFSADLSRWVGDREINICIIVNPGAMGLLLHNGGDRWRFSTFYYPDQGQRPEDFTPERCLHIIRMAMGVPDLAVELGEITAWNDAALIAERFCDRRIFLAGDSEHVMSPVGGFALNVGVEDAHNLAWKLAAVLKGWVPPVLLDSYQVERAPVSRMVIEHSARNSGSIRGTNNGSANARPALPPWRRPELSREHGLVFGMTYDSAIIVPDGTAPVQAANPVTDYVPNARPGSRAPHIWLERDGKLISTLDLFGSGLVVLAGSSGREWGVAAREFAERQGLPLVAYTVGANGDIRCADDLWKATYAIEDDGAVLVRPDGFVAWRSRSGSSDTRREMKRAISTAIGKPIH